MKPICYAIYYDTITFHIEFFCKILIIYEFNLRKTLAYVKETHKYQ